MKIAIRIDGPDKLVLACKETLRQCQAQRARYGDEVMDEVFSSDSVQQVVAICTELMEGRISEAEAQARLEPFDREIEESLAQSDSPATVMSHRARKAVKLKTLPLIAEVLVHDANIRAAAGLSKEQWIIEVIQGHGGDDGAQLSCLAYIVKLWSEGFLPWPTVS